MTKIPLPPRLPTKSGEGQEERFEYSSREMKPASLLLNDLLRAHNIFLMHHDTSLSALFVRSRRSKFIAVLTRYWDLYLSTWNVMLHGNPARDIYGGINVAASGELGVGVGEEERGSGEREVLEGFVGRVEGLVDLVVSRFGQYDPDAETDEHPAEEQVSWLGSGQEPDAEDGAIFLGTGALSRKSVRDVTHWMEDLYTWGEHAYGLIESPTSTRRARERKSNKPTRPTSDDEPQPRGPETATANPEAQNISTKQNPSSDPTASTEAQGLQATEEDEGKLDKMVSYLKMGYGTYWSLPGGGGGGGGDVGGTQADASKPKQKDVNHHLGLPKEHPNRPGLGRRTSSTEAQGHYLIGLKGDIEEGMSDHSSGSEGEDADGDRNARTVLRTVNVEFENTSEQPEATIVRDFQHPASVLTQSQVVGNMVPGYNSHDLNKASKVRVVVYVNRPFIFTFLFRLRTDSLAWDTMYRSLHHQLAPLKRSLLASTSYRPERPSAGGSKSNIHDLVWNPTSLTVHSTIPNIPETYEPEETWSRADALSTHLNLLTIHSSSRTKMTDLERTQKTSRGWWIVWTRLLEHGGHDNRSDSLSPIKESTSHSTNGSNDDGEEKEEVQGDPKQKKVDKEIFLIRRASDHIGFRNEGGAGSEGAGRLAQGIGVDTRRYVEELLSLL